MLSKQTGFELFGEMQQVYGDMEIGNLIWTHDVMRQFK